MTRTKGKPGNPDFRTHPMAPPPWLLGLGGRASSRESPGGSALPPTHRWWRPLRSLGSSKGQVFSRRLLPQICAPRQSCPCLVWPLTCNISRWPYRDRYVCASPNHAQGTELAISGPRLGYRNISRMIRGNKMQLRAILNIMTKAVNTYFWLLFFFFF